MADRRTLVEHTTPMREHVEAPDAVIARGFRHTIRGCVEICMVTGRSVRYAGRTWMLMCRYMGMCAQDGTGARTHPGTSLPITLYLSPEVDRPRVSPMQCCAGHAMGVRRAGSMQSRRVPLKSGHVLGCDDCA